MTSTTRRLSLKRAPVIGFVVGFLITIPVLVLALTTTVVETLLPVLVPGSLLLGPLTDAMASWPGAVNVGLTAIVNGLVYAVALTVVALLVPRRTADRSHI